MLFCQLQDRTHYVRFPGLRSREDKLKRLEITTPIRSTFAAGASAAFAPADIPKLRLPLFEVKNMRIVFAQAIELLHVKPFPNRLVEAINQSLGSLGYRNRTFYKKHP